MTLNNIVLSSAAFLIGAALFIGTPVYAAEKSTLSDPTIAALWAQIEVLQKQIAELQRAQKMAAIAPVFEIAATTSVATSTEAKVSEFTIEEKVQSEKWTCFGKINPAKPYLKPTCFYKW